MGYFYFDESVHTKANLVLGAFAYSEIALEGPVAEALQQSGLKPTIEEFKSGSRMCQNPSQVEGRKRLTCVIQKHCRIGLVIPPESCRRILAIMPYKG